MRIIAGNLGGRQFTSPRGHRTHPMSDRVRGALFSVLGDMNGLMVLDTFAGSGALSFEAISRGAEKTVAIDADRSAQRTIAENITSLELAGRVRLIRASVSAWLSTTDEHFDIVLCDPPYDQLQLDVLPRLAERAKPGGLVVFSLPPAAHIDLPISYQLLTRKSYGDADLVFYRRIQA